jgi:hypothetical protein
MADYGFKSANTAMACCRSPHIRCERRLALDAGRPTEPGNLTLKEPLVEDHFVTRPIVLHSFVGLLKVSSKYGTTGFVYSAAGNFMKCSR